MTIILTIGFCVYALTFLFTSSHALKGPRELLGELLDEYWPEREYKMEECRMCIGVWVTLVLWIVSLPWTSFHDLPAFIAGYGLSYFLATQER